MRALALLVGLCTGLAGCVELASPKASPTTGSLLAGRTYDNTTVEGVLQNSPHLKINSGMTLAWHLENATREKPAVATTLIKLLGDYKSGMISMDGDIQLVAFIPVEGTIDLGACGPTPSKVHAMQRLSPPGERDDDPFGNLSGTFAKGWYHVVIVAFEDAMFQLSFEADKEAKPRTLPRADPFVEAGAISVSGARDISHSLSNPGEHWLAWATHDLEGRSGSVDGGRSMRIELGCQANERTSSSGFGSQSTISVSAAGPEKKVEIKGTYKPSFAAVADNTNRLEVAWAFIKAIPVETPAASASAA